MDNIIIISNTNSIENAKLIANTLVDKKLAACVNIIPKIISVYRWQNKIENDDEITLLIKTKKELFTAVQFEIEKLHPYDIPEIISIKIEDGNNDYLDWLNQNLS